MSCPTYIDSGLGFATGGGGGGGTVTSVGLSMPSIFATANTPVTTSGVLTVTLNTQIANTIFSGPTTGAPAVPTFRQLVAQDMNVTFTNGQYLTTNGSGVLSWATLSAGAPSAPVNSIQFNNAGSFGGSSVLTYINSTNQFLYQTASTGRFLLWSAATGVGASALVQVFPSDPSTAALEVRSSGANALNCYGTNDQASLALFQRSVSGSGGGTNANIYSSLTGVTTGTSYNCYYITSASLFVSSPTFFFWKRGFTTSPTFVVAHDNTASVQRYMIATFDAASDAAGYGTMSYRVASTATSPTLGSFFYPSYSADTIPVVYLGSTSLNKTCLYIASAGSFGGAQGSTYYLVCANASLGTVFGVGDVYCISRFGNSNITTSAIPVTGEQRTPLQSFNAGTTDRTIVLGSGAMLEGRVEIEMVFTTAANNNSKTIAGWINNFAGATVFSHTGNYNNATIVVRCIGASTNFNQNNIRWYTEFLVSDATGHNPPLMSNTFTTSSMDGFTIKATVGTNADLTLVSYTTLYRYRGA